MATFYCNYFLLGTRGPLTPGGPLDFAYTLPTPLLRHWLGCARASITLTHDTDPNVPNVNASSNLVAVMLNPNPNANPNVHLVAVMRCIRRM